MEYSRSRIVGEVELFETFKGDVDEIEKLSKSFASHKALTVKDTEIKPIFSESKHIDWLGLTANESKVQYHGFSTVNLEISFCAKSPQETDQALCEIVEAATKFFQRSLEDGYHFEAPGSKSVDTQKLGAALEAVQNINKEVTEGTE